MSNEDQTAPHSAVGEESTTATIPSGLVDLRELRYFVVLAEELHFGRAAERLHISQSPLSQAIAQVEQKLRTTLIDRSNRPIQLTTAGAVLLGHARRVLAEADDAVSATLRAGAGEAGTLRIAMGRYIPGMMLPQIRSGLAGRFPNLELDVIEASNDEVVVLVERGAADVAVAVAPSAADDLGSQLLRREHAAALVHRSNPLAKQPQVHVAELSGYPLLLWPREEAAGAHDVVRSLFLEHQPVSTKVLDAFDSGWWTDMVAGGFTVGPAGMAVTPDFVAVPIEGTDGIFETLVLWSTRTPPLFLDVLRDSLDELSAQLGWL